MSISIHQFAASALTHVGSVSQSDITLDPGQGFEGQGVHVRVIDDLMFISDYGATNSVGSGDGGLVIVMRNDGAGNWSQEAILENTTAGEEYFGWSLDYSAGTLVVGVAGRIAGHRGAACIYTVANNVWTLEQKITPPNNVVWEFMRRFGSSVAISGDSVAIGAFDYENEINGDGQYNSDLGIVRFYTRTAGVWTQTTQIEGTAANQRFGVELGITGNDLIVSAQRAGGTGIGNILIYGA